MSLPIFIIHMSDYLKLVHCSRYIGLGSSSLSYNCCRGLYGSSGDGQYRVGRFSLEIGMKIVESKRMKT